MTTTTHTLQTDTVQELTDAQLEQVNGGFFWFLFMPVITKIVTAAAMATASHFAAEGTKKSAKALGASDPVAEVIGEGVGLLV